MGTLHYILCNGWKQKLCPEGKEHPAEPGGMKSSHYIGMTVGSAHNRWKSHSEGHEGKSKGNPLYKHDVEHNNSGAQDYEARVVSRDISLLTLSESNFEG